MSDLILKHRHLDINKSLKTGLLVVGDSGEQKVYFIPDVFFYFL